MQEYTKVTVVYVNTIWTYKEIKMLAIFLTETLNVKVS